MSDYSDEIAESTRIIGKRPGREETTRQADRRPRPGQNDPTELMGRGGATRTQPVSEEGHTQVLGRPTSRGSQERTQVFGREEVPSNFDEASGALNDPVVGWLVIVDGPGRGNFIRLGYGQNSVGRAADERVPVNYGDMQISGKSHCFIIYEQVGRDFIIRPGNGKGLTYLNQKVVLEARLIQSGELLRLGATTLRFMAFCGPEYDWQDGPLPAAKAAPRPVVVAEPSAPAPDVTA